MTHPLDSLDIYVWEASSAIAQRVESLLAGTEAVVVRADGLTEAPATAVSRSAVAVVSVTAVNGQHGRPHAHEWLTGRGLPLIWVAAHARETAAGYFPPEYTNILPPDFSGAELRALLSRVAGAVEADERRRAKATPFIAESDCMRELLREATAFADCQASVMVYGETGVGKERVARLLHDGNALYGRGPFVAVNCGAIPEGLFESHFFGHAKGAFTGAAGLHKGYFEQANGGTLFLDEIGDLPPYQQVKLLRVLEQSTVTRLGSTAEVRVDFRLVAATNRDLRSLVDAGTFRADLYYRLAVVELTVPNLEDRGAADKVAIFRALLGELAGAAAEDVPGWLLQRVGAARYPGNVRELRNVAERLAIVRRQFDGWDETRVLRVLSRLDGGPSADAPPALSERDTQERERVMAALQANQWRRQDTAAHLGISRKVLWEKMRKLRIESTDADEERNTDTGVFF
ncbi:sigma-54-dependent Fis family transcriptional regulator [Achromobacter sp. GG226]|uniref:sigma 54-interacting transcriptional regulator n=1 Tax=Verticiella alkaliphila TaxID=2779529 RepID=UPI001C0D5485|nr:sigma-54 dependent transcriptional regulator [Verticiella sp. GG226]MBU4612145.1 sigma-54-dependent Fis family transcriptional regulator [Verticiella sp. GG226]